MCFLHSDNAVSRRQFIQQVSVGTAAAAALAGVDPKLALAAEGIDAQGVGDPDVVVPAAAVASDRVIDGFSKVLQNRWNQDLPPVAKVGQGEAVQFLCRDALDIGVAARTLTP